MTEAPARHGRPADWASGAILGSNGKYRYRLWRKWADGPLLMYVMLNPSTADHQADDPTIRRCVRFAKDHGFQGIEVVNLFAFRATAPSDLSRAGYPEGPDNMAHILAAARDSDAICCAWGANSARLSAPAGVVAELRARGHELKCLGITQHGIPRHPLMLPLTAQLKPFLPTGVAANA